MRTNYLYDPNNPAQVAMIVIISIWSLVWKGIALWKSAKNNQRNWYIAMLLIHFFGILEIVYLKFFQKKLVSSKKKK